MTTAEEDPPSSPKARKRHVATRNTKTNAENNNNNQKDKPQSQSARIRQGIVQNNKKEHREHRRIARISAQSQTSIQKIYLALIMNIILVFMGLMLYFNPAFFFHNLHRHQRNASNSSKIIQWPPHHLAVLYPPNTNPKEDLPQFFQQYAIATPDNLAARTAVRKLLRVRHRLKPFQIFVTAWEREQMVLQYPMDEYCGQGFQRAYNDATSALHKHSNTNIRHAEDLLLWCLLHTYQNDGFLQWNTTLERAPISASRNLQHVYSQEDTLKGIVPKHVGQNRIHPSFLWLPKKRERQTVDGDNGDNPDTETESNNKKTVTTFDMNSQVPSKILPWLIHTASSLNAWEYAKASEEYLYQLIQEERDHWMVLDTVCDYTSDGDENHTTETSEQQQASSNYQNRRVMGRDCLVGEAGADSASSCCTVYMPEGDTIRMVNTNKKLRRQHHLSSSDSRD